MPTILIFMYKLSSVYVQNRSFNDSFIFPSYLDLVENSPVKVGFILNLKIRVFQNVCIFDEIFLNWGGEGLGG